MNLYHWLVNVFSYDRVSNQVLAKFSVSHYLNQPVSLLVDCSQSLHHPSIMSVEESRAGGDTADSKHASSTAPAGTKSSSATQVN